VDPCGPPHEEEHSAVTEPQRLALYGAARAALGDEEADTLMALTPPANTDLATRQDVDRVDERLRAHIDRVDERLRAHIDRVEERLRAHIDRSELSTRLWMLAVLVTSQIAVVTYLTNTLG